jgi:hypothetical protein
VKNVNLLEITKNSKKQAINLVGWAALVPTSETSIFTQKNLTSLDERF